MIWLKQSTSVDVGVGPFLDSTDGNTIEDTLTITQPDIRLKKNGGNWAQKAAAQTLTHEEFGWYELTLDATDTDTLGVLIVAIHESGALPVWKEYMVVPANVWDSFFGADKLQVHVDEMTAGIITATVVADGTIDAATFAAGAINAAAIADDAIDAGAIAADAITAAKVADDVGNQFADQLIARNIEGGSSAGRIVKDVLAVHRNRVTVDAGTGDIVVYAADDTTPLWEGVATINVARGPITEINPD